jgi:hypothetical protein
MTKRKKDKRTNNDLQNISPKKNKKGTGYEYDGNVAWVLQVRRAEVVTK